ncbi:amino acid ABC transporter substrate-binding protein [Pseudoalteromonas piscicida]|uniref:amino acid ABC transporter substrate-binding protein n=1 Tax=Pseudoalteromonas piscicida TaxID=43662 RepID=UPI00309600AC
MRFFVVFALAITTWASSATEVRFCYEDKHAPPFIHEAGQTMPDSNPGITIEIVKQLDGLLEYVDITYTRKPWSRCLHELQNGKVDAVVASYRKSREAFMAYPKKADGGIDNQYAINRIGSCLLKSKTNKAEITLDTPLELAIPRGYAIREGLPKQFAVFETDSLENAIALVEQDLLDATVGLCQIGNMPVTLSPPFDKLEALYPPIEISFGFMAFSKQFYQNYPEKTWQVWRASQQVDLDQMYKNYLDAQLFHPDKQ